MSSTAQHDDPKLWERIKEEVIAGDRGGRKDQWSARKAQLATSEYQQAGGGYVGPKDEHNSLHEWQEENWGTKSGGRSGDTGERYLPKAAREALSDGEYKRTTAKKRRDTAKGRQFSAQPGDVAKKTAPYRDGKREGTKAALMAEARKRDVPGRSKMTKAELARALGR